MTAAEFSVILARIARFYPRFYENTDPAQVNADWFPYFRDNSFQTVNRAVDACINTLRFPPTVADIKAQIVESYQQDRPTSIEAFQVISHAVSKATDKTSAAEQYNALPPILRKLVGTPNALQDWNRVSTEAFQTVVMSAIRESYTELVKREAKYYAFPAELQQAEQWRIEAPEAAALPEPKQPKTIDEMISDREISAEKYREQQGIEANPEYADRVQAFKQPLTHAEELMLEAKEKHEFNQRMDWMKKRLEAKYN